MPKNTNEDNFKNKLNFIGLDLNNIPEFLKKFENLEFKVSKNSQDNEYKIYRYIPINKIEILITPKNRLEDLKEKYASAKPIYKYLIPESEEDIECYTIFLDMLKKVNIEKIEEIGQIQDKVKSEVPFIVKYSKSYEWQIYYSESVDKYFMLLPSQEAEYECLFYLLKKQIEYYKNPTNEVPMIYAPINHIEYSGEILKKSEIIELENYLWLFTKEWAVTYEVTDAQGKNYIQIVGETFVYDGIKAKYKIILKSRDEALEYYKKVKALFVIQTEISHYYTFKTKINENSELEFYYKDAKIEYDKFLEFIKTEYIKVENLIKENKEKLQEKENTLAQIKSENEKQEKEYFYKQKQIATFLKYKKTFLGRVKYYFKLKNKKSDSIITKEVEEKKQEENKINEDIEIIRKEYYTIEDLVSIYSILDKQIKTINTIELDILAAQNKSKLIKKRIENASLYIEEIEKHKKSIFEFWKFATKDEANALEEGQDSEQSINKKLEKTFDYNTDFEDLGIQADKIQREKLSKEEHDSIFVADTIILKAINIIKRQIEDKQYNDEDDKELEEILTEVKKQLNTDIQYYSTKEFNIFGSITEEINSVKSLGNKKHREVKKNIFKILEINQKTSLFEFKNIIKKTYALIDESMKKINSLYNMNIYIVDDVSNSNYVIGYINPENALKATSNLKEVNLYKLEIKENMPIIYYTNNIYYDNYNRTLPLGMNISDKVFIDLSKLNLNLKKQEEIKTNLYTEQKVLALNEEFKKVIIKEYSTI